MGFGTEMLALFFINMVFAVIFGFVWYSAGFKAMAYIALTIIAGQLLLHHVLREEDQNGS